MASSHFEFRAARKRRLRAVLTLVMWGGLAVAAWPLAQKGYGWWSQRQLMADWDARSAGNSAPKTAKFSVASNVKSPKNSPTASNSQTLKTSVGATARDVTLPGQAAREKVPAATWPQTRLRISDIGVDAIVVQGLDEKSLARGPGHDPRSVLPGANGNCVLAAHRNVYGAWFYRVDELWAGSKIELENAQGRFEYEVLSVQTVSESDYTVLRSNPKGPPQLTLITCTLPHSPNRIIVTAQMHTDL